VSAEARDREARSVRERLRLHVRIAAGRKALGLMVGDSESEAFWKEFLRSLRERGLSGVRPVITDQHSGLVAAAARSCSAPPGKGAVFTSCATSST
jgi:transposase-like protein